MNSVVLLLCSIYVFGGILYTRYFIKNYFNKLTDENLEDEDIKTALGNFQRAAAPFGEKGAWILATLFLVLFWLPIFSYEKYMDTKKKS